MIKRLGLIALCTLLASSLVACEDKAVKKVEVQPVVEQTQPQQAPVKEEVKPAEPATPANSETNVETQPQQ